MTEKPEHDDEREAPKRPRVSRWAIFRSVGNAVLSLAILVVLFSVALAVFHPETPLPDEWNPMAPLDVSDPVSPLTTWKLRAVLNDPTQCIATVQAAATVAVLPPFEETENCHVRNRVTLAAVGNVRLDPINTSCATALLVAMWERHGLQSAARDHLGTDVTVIRQIGSYNCRPIRTTSGNATRWSTHSTADAIDITGFDFADGRRVRLISDWDDGTDKGRFLSAVRDSACTWFATTLGPDFNSLHADHFHLQARGWGTCR